MLIDFCTSMRAARMPVSTKEFLCFLEALAAGVVPPRMNEIYALARCTLVKDETLFDRFDRAFAEFAKKVSKRVDFSQPGKFEWLQAHLAENVRSACEAALPGLDWQRLVDSLREAYAEQRPPPGDEAPTGPLMDTRPPQRQGPEDGGQGMAAWDERLFREYDDTLQLGARNMKVALRRLRRFTRQGTQTAFDLDATIAATANNAGWLDIRHTPRRDNRAKVLLLMDAGGSMDEHVRQIEQLFGAMKSEFKRLEFYYFHNCVYDYVWRNNQRQEIERTPTWDLIRRYDKEHALMLLGDATMSPSELLRAGGSAEYNNSESGSQWLQRLLDSFPRHVWINPEPEPTWSRRPTIRMIKDLMGQRMVPLTVKGLETGMTLLSR